MTIFSGPNPFSFPLRESFYFSMVTLYRPGSDRLTRRCSRCGARRMSAAVVSLLLKESPKIPRACHLKFCIL